MRNYTEEALNSKGNRFKELSDDALFEQWALSNPKKALVWNDLPDGAKWRRLFNYYSKAASIAKEQWIKHREKELNND